MKRGGLRRTPSPMKTGLATRIFAVTCLSLVLCACGGGGGGGTVPTGSSATSTPSGTNAILTITAPSVGQSSRTRKAAYVPATLQSLAVTVNGTAITSAIFECSGTSARTCSAVFAVPAGSDAFDIVLFGNSSKPLAETSFTQTMPSGVSTALNPTFDGIVNSASLTISNPYPQLGTATTLNVGIHALDADGNFIDGDPLATPVSITLQNGNGHFTLANNTFTNATQQLALNYDGHYVQAATLAITTSNITSQNAMVVPNVFQTFGPISGFVMSVFPGSGGAVWFVDCQAGNGGPCQPGLLSGGTTTLFASVPDLVDGALGPDGNMWFTGGSENPYIYKVTTSGVETPYLTHAISGPSEAYDSYAIVEGPDGNMWFTEGDRIGVITTSGTVTEYMLNGYNRPQTLVVGPDGRLWFDNWQSVGAITTSGTITYYPLKAGEYFASGVAFASDGNLHFFASVPGTNSGVGLRTMTMSGVETTITTGIPGNNSGNNYSIVEGPDGNLWGTFTGYPTLAANGVTLTAELADETAAGVVQEFYVVPNSAAAFGSYLTVAPDHSMWTGWQNTITHVLYNP